MIRRSSRSMLHLQMGQEVLYLLMTIGLMSSLVLLVYARFLYIENTNLKAAQIEAAEYDNSAAELAARRYEAAEQDRLRDKSAAEVATLRDEAARLAELRDEAAAQLAEIKAARGRLPPRDDQPPIITLTEAQGYSFASGSAELSDEFRALIARQIVPRIREISSRYEARVVEVIGHTDEIPVRSGNSTIDQNLLGFLIQPSSVEPVVADNVGLGMVRAASVVRELRSDPRLEALTILPLSAGQTTTARHELSLGATSPQDDETRRRIEIRVRRHVDD